MKKNEWNRATFLAIALLAIVNFNSGWANSTIDKVKEFIDDASEIVKNEVENLGNDFAAIQNYLDNYPWKGVLEEEASSGAATLKHVQFNGHSKALVVAPGEQIEVVAQCALDPDKCSSLVTQRVVVGIHGEGPQTVIGNVLGIRAGESKEKFTLTAPSKSGIYQVRFRHVEAVFEKNAFNAWTDEKGNEPDARTNVGFIFVKS